MIKQLAFTRFIAAVAIVFFHYGQDIQFFKDLGIHFLVEKGSIGVSYFFVLSGFVMVVAYSKESYINFKNYLWNRFARIYPLYFLALLLVVFLYFTKANLLDFSLNLLMMQAWFPNKALTLNLPGWSLSVELFFYILFPFLYNSIYQQQKFSNLLIPIITIWILTQIIFYYLNIKHYTINSLYNFQDYCYLPILHLNSFLIGNLAGLYFVKHRDSPERNYIVPMIVLVFCISYILSFEVYFHNGLLAIPFALLLLFLSKSTDFLTQIIKNKFFIYLGEISFGIYILQYPIFMICTDFRISKYFNLHLTDHSEVYFFIKVVLLLIFSTISYFFVEKPLRDKLKKWIK